ncbi:HNH endonuclease [Nonomuraea terrae]|uniref:HNH endonuclease n=1 Tax=Nonomuraea terrae TaxID=2530383 RepID=A0A4R4ZDY0_9ACTN|nr:HNH endonuclease family protein [Nonomuraea terrae]TDD56256.1 HNH endonuclease [Nonomuraea terrae]
MIFLRRAAHVAVLALMVIPIAAVLAAKPAAAEQRKRSQAAALARSMLTQLKIARPLSISGYSRAKFQPSWPNRRGKCSTREIVLARDARSIRRDSRCHPVRGTWFSPYDGKRLKSEKNVDVDHLVPLSYAWRSGAKRWSPAKRRAFANDLTRPELITVSHSANIAKGGKGPQSWRPQRRAYWCRYATSWITVKHHYGLFVTSRERVALLNMLRTC